jgi:hypothetical protein
MNFQPLSRLTPRSVPWLWPLRLARGKLAILEGDPGLGKSLVALDLCARLSTGRPFPDGAPGIEPTACIILNGEDGTADTLRPRLETLGADLSRIFILHQEDTDAADLFRLPAQAAQLNEVLTATRAGLVVIDPITAFLDSSVVTFHEQSVRRALLPLARLAEKYQCTIFMLRHLNKRNTGPALYRGTGSIGFLAVCRSGWLLAPDPEDGQRRILAQLKNNLAPPQPSLALAVQRADDLSPPNVSWLGPTGWTADQLLAARRHGPAPVAEERARKFLADFLHAGPRTAREIWQAAERDGHSFRTLERAKKDLMIRSISVYPDKRRVSYWLLPGQELPPTIPKEAIPPDLEPWLEPIRQQYPPSTPLDDL